MMQKVLTHKQRDWAYEKWCEGRTQAEIADALHVCTKTINRALRDRPRIKPVLVYKEE